MNYDKLGKIIQQLRKRNNLTQAEFARRSEISCSQIIRLETGTEINPRINTLEKLANAVNYEVVISFEPIEAKDGNAI